MITVKELIRELQLHDGNAMVDFYPLTFYRVKSRGEDVCQIEFNEALVKDQNGEIRVTKS